MLSRERVIRAINHDYPDRVPLSHGILPAAWYTYGERLKEIVEKYPADLYKPKEPREWEVWDNFLDRVSWGIEDDFANIAPRSFQYGQKESGEASDEWGCVWKKVEPGIAGIVVKSPLENWEEVRSYNFPDPLAYWRFDVPNLQSIVKEAREKGKYIIAYGGNLFELMQWLRGYENLLTDFIEHSERVNLLAEQITEYNIKTVQYLGNFDVDCISFQDDWGAQTQLMINPKLWRKLFKPFYRKMFKEAHELGFNVLFHSDGYILDIIPDLIEIGVDILNPQFSCMDLYELRSLTKDKVCILSDIDRQYILPKGTPEEVKKYINNVFDLFGDKKGGFIFRGWIISGDTPLENIKSMYEAYEYNLRRFAND